MSALPALPAAPFTLYGRSYCHLCDDMLAALRALETARQPFAITVRDIDLEAEADPDLLARLDALVPVLFGAPDQPELCHYFLDPDAVRAYLARLPGNPAGRPEIR